MVYNLLKWCLTQSIDQNNIYDQIMHVNFVKIGYTNIYVANQLCNNKNVKNAAENHRR